LLPSCNPYRADRVAYVIEATCDAERSVVQKHGTYQNYSRLHNTIAKVAVRGFSQTLISKDRR
jgi:hypothetical protein